MSNLPSHSPFPRFTEPQPPEGLSTWLRGVLVLVSGLLLFSLGCAVMYFVIVHTDWMPIKKKSGTSRGASESREPLIPNADSKESTLPLPPLPRLQTPLIPAQIPQVKPQENELRPIVDLLRTQYLEPSTILTEQLDIDALTQLLSAPDRLARLTAEPALAPWPGARTVIDTLRDNIGYWRPARLDDASISALARQWALWKSAPASGLIIDLRYFRDGNQFAGAASLLGLFLQPGTHLFSIQPLDRPQQVFQSALQPLDVPARFPILILTNTETRGAAEMIAFILSRRAGALLVGSATAAECAVYSESRLATKRFLRLATARVTLPDGSDLLGRSIPPDISVSYDRSLDLSAFLRGYQTPPSFLVREPDLGPGLDVRKTEKSDSDLPTPDDAEVKRILEETDSVLQAAADIIHAIRFRPADIPTLIEFELERSAEPNPAP